MRKYIGIVLIPGIVCLFLTNCIALRDIYGGNKRLAKEYKAQLVSRYGERVKDAKVWVADDGAYMTINFKDKGLPVRDIDSRFTAVTDTNANEIAITFLKANTDIFGTTDSDFEPENENVQIVPRDTVASHHAAYLTQIYNGVPVKPEDSGGYRYMEPFSGNVDVIFSGSAILSIRSGVVRNINHDTGQTLSMNMAWNSIQQMGKASNDSVSMGLSTSSLTPLPKSARLIILSNPLHRDSTLLVWEILLDAFGSPTFYVDAHSGQVVLFRVE